MAYLTITKSGNERIFQDEPQYYRDEDIWKSIELDSELQHIDPYDYSCGTESVEVERVDYGIELPPGTIEKILGYKIEYHDGAIEF